MGDMRSQCNSRSCLYISGRSNIISGRGNPREGETPFREGKTLREEKTPIWEGTTPFQQGETPRQGETPFREGKTPYPSKCHTSQAAMATHLFFFGRFGVSPCLAAMLESPYTQVSPSPSPSDTIPISSLIPPCDVAPECPVCHGLCSPSPTL